MTLLADSTAEVQIDPIVAREAQRRRTFAIISHPDAGKTTLTEKLLLYAGAVDVAGAVRGRKTQRAATSDWMELERKRGISVSSTVLSFEYDGKLLNLLDTPGHEDFSEDTYRTLMAADAAVMVIDLAKGIEPQTEKLFRICARRGIPILTFVNKVDRPGKPPLEILQEIESVLGIEGVAYNWPIGSGLDFCGVYDMQHDTAEIFTRGQNGSDVVDSTHCDLRSDAADLLPEAMRQETLDEVDLLRGASARFDPERFLRGQITPVFFGSALNNFGVENFLRAFIDHSPAPSPRQSNIGPVEVHRGDFAGFVFKIQANLDPKHRDRIAFVRVCAGRFVREMEVMHPRSGKKLKLRRAHRLFAQDRETMDEAFPGDIIGLVNPGEFHLGDTICGGAPLKYEPLPQFSPEFFALLRCKNTAKRKQFERGLEQLVEEGAIQVLRDPDAMQSLPILAAVGELQFDVVRFRLESEYGVDSGVDWLSYKMARWIGGEEQDIQKMHLPYAAKRVLDRDRRWVLLVNSKWDLQHCLKENPKLTFAETSLLE